MTFSKISYYACVKTSRTGGGNRGTLTALLLSLSLYSSFLVTAVGQQDSRDELLSRWSAAAAERQNLWDERLSRWSTAATERQDLWDESLSLLLDTYARGTSTAAADTPCAPHRDTELSVVTLARDGRQDGTPCPTVEGLWLSTNLETAFDMRATSVPGRLDVRAVGSDWTGGAESLFGDRGPVTAIVSQPATGTTVTFVGHCRASHGVDTMTGVWVIASPEKNKFDHHLAVQPIPDTLHRLQVE
ncbi:hypothetical protein QTP88_016621 [Uroleucon formosanum]